MLLLFNSVHGKKNAENQDRLNFESVRATCNLQSCYNFAIVLQLHRRVTRECNRFQLISA